MGSIGGGPVSAAPHGDERYKPWEDALASDAAMTPWWRMSR